MKKLIFLLLLSTSIHALDFEVEINSNLKGSLRKNSEQAVLNIRSVLNDGNFWSKVYAIESFTCTDENTPSIDEIRNMKVDFKLRKYWHFKKKVKAKTVGSTVSLNSRAGARTPEALSNTIFHELLHVAGLGHCGVNNISKHPHIKNSIPYVLGRLLEESLK